MRGSSAVVALALMLVACGSDEGDNTTGDPGDGKYRPPSSGEHTTEAIACNALVDAHSKQLVALGCSGTSRICPNMLRTEFAESCLEYDKGSVDGCVAYYKMQASCADLATALDACVITAYEGSAPAGCP